MLEETSTRSKRLAIFHTHLNVGGVERILVNLMHELDDRGYEIDLILVSEEGEFLSEVPDGVRTINLERSRGPAIGIFASIPSLVQYLKKMKPSALLSAKTAPNLVTLISQRIASVPTRTIISLHWDPSYHVNKPLNIKQITTNKLAKYLYPQADSVVAVSKEVKNKSAAIFNIPTENIAVIHNPVVTPRLIHQSKEQVNHPWFTDSEVPVILSVGRIHPHKNYSMLIHAFSSVRKEEDARLVIIGKGKMKPKLESLITELNLENDVSLPGSSKNPYPYMRQASVLVVSSVTEALPSTLIEAMACGCPVVSTNCSSGPREILKNGEFGELVPVNDPNALAEAIIATLRNPPRPAKLQERAMDFTAGKIADEYEHVLFPDGHTSPI